MCCVRLSQHTPTGCNANGRVRNTRSYKQTRARIKARVMCNDGHESPQIAFFNATPRSDTQPILSRETLRAPWYISPVVIARVYLQVRLHFSHQCGRDTRIGNGRDAPYSREKRRKREREHPAGPSSLPSSILAHQARFSRLGTSRTPIDAEETRIAAFISAIITAFVCATRERVFEQRLDE